MTERTASLAHTLVGLAVVAAAAGAAGCSPGGTFLAIDLRTDLTPGIEFHSVRVRVLADGGDDPERFREASAERERSYRDGVRVAEFDGLEPGRVELEVSLLGRDGQTVVERSVLFELRGRKITRVTVTRDCRDVSCPAPDGESGALSCFNGACVDPRCSDEASELCGDALCETAADCAEVSACAERSCEAGACVATTDPDACASGLWCHPEQGCAPVPDDVVLRPANVGDRIGIDEGEGDFVVGEGEHPIWVVDADDGSITAYSDLDAETATTEVVRPAGPGDAAGIRFTRIPGGETAYGVLAVGSLEVTPEGWLIGTGGVPLIVLAATEIRVAGVVTAGADRVPGRRAPGPGGHQGGLGRSREGNGPGGGGAGDASTSGAFSGGGGAGGSFASPGGSGGNGSGPGGMVAEAYGDPSLSPLVGGSGGGSGGGRGAKGLGGHGGGALQLSAGRRLVVEQDGIVDAGGGGGLGNEGSGGGGSGGALLLEAPEVDLRGFVGANGGAGGHPLGYDGEGGWAARVPAPGRPTENSRGGGGAGSDAAGQADPGLAGASGGGGGGGGAGRVRIQTAIPTDRYPDALITPRLETGFSTTGVIAME